MSTVAYTCPFVPPEWIAAHGLRPQRIVPAVGGACAGAMPASAGVCPYARSFVNAVAAADCRSDAVVFTTVCDQMRRAAEVFSTVSGRPVFLMNVPSTWQTPAAMGLYVDELRRLGRFLVRLGGTTPSDEHLGDVMLAYDADRAALRAAPGRPLGRGTGILPVGPTGVPPVESFGSAAETAVRHMGETPMPPPAPSAPHRVSASSSSSSSASVPLAILGGPLAAGQHELLDVIEQFGGHVVLDATEGGELTLPPPLDAARVRQDPLVVLAEAYFGAIPHPMRRPNGGLYDWLAARLAERGAGGVLLHRWPWCDLWHGELGRLRQWAPVPVLDLGAGGEGLDLARQAGRIQAFLEMLREPRR
jgi:benzoyl-CoA reductase/2-hydroxyglutaryl-CoA dehydratase subunit BcrC/BadD/HgdB